MDLPREVTAALTALAAVFLTAGAFFAPAAGPGGAPSPAPAPSAPLPGVGRQTSGAEIRVLLEDGAVATLPLEEYVYGVLRAEMPASFAPAALEAQAVCARTYALSRAQSGAHGPEADVCADPGCCQSYNESEPADWGDKAGEYRAKLQSAVAATAGQVLTQDGRVISAVFHAASQGATAPAQAVWGSAVPYLVSVPTPETPETVPRLESEVFFSYEELRALLAEQCPQADLSAPPEDWIGGVERADWGGVERLRVGGAFLTGGQARSLFSLRSARFEVESGSDGVTFRVTGYGHGVGMSQQGANLMAKDGADYRAILAHYYPGTVLEHLPEERA